MTGWWRVCGTLDELSFSAGTFTVLVPYRVCARWQASRLKELAPLLGKRVTARVREAIVPDGRGRVRGLEASEVRQALDGEESDREALEVA